MCAIKLVILQRKTALLFRAAFPRLGFVLPTRLRTLLRKLAHVGLATLLYESVATYSTEC